jgi:hypothetical protein
MTMFFKKKKFKKNILVHYINVDDIDPSAISVYIDTVKNQLGSPPDNCYRYFIPVKNQETRIEVHYLV